MPLQTYISPWSGYAVRHIPDNPGKTYDIYDFRYCGRSNENRWNVAGEPTLYLAKEKDVALAEYARHFKVNRTRSLANQTYRRQVFRFRVELECVLDLTNPEVWSALSLEKAPDCFKDKTIARSTANFIRNTTSTQAIVVPSIAFLDNLEQWCLVVFLEKLLPETRNFLPSVEADGFFQIA
ncbi:RES domain-containing protein [Gloeocapsopsis crepidinum LEGE 06123]|uniref:RES domain-containing protein n=1 Tax=Gloeocapsopsis crepidinum LEGE 06123 TaxID=588587 RepID=A0ABR9UTJ2_9CHRO|nr:RES family NAD+ phosphorylase [Gloeocapsopsis crepidinum]MBE9190673.1 RES domain-containing protein [Gloeocapsopsis crepidinum LEGE 06123]